MPDAGGAERVGTPVMIRGLLRGAELACIARLFTEPGRLVLERDEGPAWGRRLRIPVLDLDGVRWRDPQLMLFLRDGDVLEVEGEAELAALELQLLDHASSLGEMTRSLHALGSSRSPGGKSHDTYYAPLLRARREASSARRISDRLAAFDPAALRTRYQAVLRELSAARWPDEPAERRALEAEVEEQFAPVLASIVRLAIVAGEAREAADDVRLLAWRAWSAQVGELFVVADRCWQTIGRTLERPVPPRASWWRSIGRRSAG